MSIAKLTIDLEARIASFEAGMGRAERQLDKLVESTRSKFTDIGSVFLGSLGASAFQEIGGAVVRFLPDLIDGVARFQDMAEASNASAEGLASFRTAADVSGVSVEDLNGFMVKLTANLSKTTDESRGTGRALQRLGLDVQAFRALRPDQQIEALAQAFNTFSDSAEKTAIARALFARGGEQVLRFFKEFEAQGGAIVRVTDAQIQAADAWSDSIARTRSELRQQAELMALQTLPAMTALMGAAADVARQFFGVGDATRELRADTAILDWAEAGAVAVGTVAEALVGIAKLARAVGGSFQAVGADIALPFRIGAAIFQANAKGPTERLADVLVALNDRNATVDEANKRYVDLWNYNGTAITDAIKRNFSAVRATLDSENARELARFNRQAQALQNKRTLAPFTLTDPQDDRRAEQAQRAYEALIETITRRNAAAEVELQTGQKQSEVDAFATEVRARLAKTTAELTQQQRVEIQQALQAFEVNGRRLEQQRQAAQLRSVESRALAQQLAERDQANRRLAEENQQIGLTARQVEDLAAARLESAIAAQEEKIAVLSLLDAQSESIGQLRLITEGMREQLRLRRAARAISDEQRADTGRGVREAVDEFFDSIKDKAGEAKRVTADAFRNLQDDLATSLRTGQFNIRRTVDSMIDELLRINVVKPALAWLSNLGGGAVSSALSFLLGSASGNAFASGAVQPFALGGILGASGGLLTGPTVFPMRGGRLGLGGEAGTEAVLPLVRGRGGKLGVQASGGGGPTTINDVKNFFEVGAGVTRAEVLSLLNSYGQRLKAEMLQTMTAR